MARGGEGEVSGDGDVGGKYLLGGGSRLVRVGVTSRRPSEVSGLSQDSSHTGSTGVDTGRSVVLRPGETSTTLKVVPGYSLGDLDKGSSHRRHRGPYLTPTVSWYPVWLPYRPPKQSDSPCHDLGTS